MEPKQPMPLWGLVLIGVGSLILLASVRYQIDAARHASDGVNHESAQQTLHRIPPIPFGR